MQSTRRTLRVLITNIDLHLPELPCWSASLRLASPSELLQSSLQELLSVGLALSQSEVLAGSP